MAHLHLVRIVVVALVTVAGWFAARAFHPTAVQSRERFDFANAAVAQLGLLEQAFSDIVDAGVPDSYGGEVLRRLTRYALDLLEREKVCKLDEVRVVEFVVTTYAALWPARSAARVLVALQRQLDAEAGATDAHCFGSVLAQIRDGKTASEILSSNQRLRATRLLLH